MTKEQMRQLRSLMAVVDIQQMRYGQVNDGRTDFSLHVTYTVPGLQGSAAWFDETISPRGHVIDRTIVPAA